MYGQIVRMMLDNRISVSGPAAGAPTPANTALFDQHALPYIAGTGPTRLPGAKLSTVLLNRWEDWAMAHWRAFLLRRGRPEPGHLEQHLQHPVHAGADELERRQRAA